MSKTLWQNTQESINNSNLATFLHAINKSELLTGNNFSTIHQWTIENYESFWEHFLENSQTNFTGKAHPAFIPDSRSGDNKMFPRGTWFPNVKLNFTENLLSQTGDSPALVSIDELGNRKELSWDMLHTQVASMALFLQKRGITRFDRVVGIVSNKIENVIAMLATASIGAIWSSCSPEFGTQAILDRFAQIEPKALFISTRYSYNGKTHYTAEKLLTCLYQLPSIEMVIADTILGLPNLESHVSSFDFNDCIADFTKNFIFEKFPFDHPLFIMFSSGTTGKPKCIVHGAGGTLLQHKKEHLLHNDLKTNERILYYTTTGWMMWQWLLGALACGGTVYLYDGSPTYPNDQLLLDLLENEAINIFGTSPKYLSHLEKSINIDFKKIKLNHLRAILSTGAPLLTEQFIFINSKIKKDLQIASISGGTDIISCFVLGNNLSPVNAGEIQGAGLGLNVAIMDEDGNEIIDLPGELVCKNPFPCMPLYFWNDKDNKNYREAYFDVYPDIWCHRDWAKQTKSNGFVIYGRSDSTLNPGGIRIGTAEIYTVVNTLPKIIDSLVVDQEWDGDRRIILFIVLQDKSIINDSLKNQIKSTLKSNCSPRHVPAKIIAVPEIPRTISGKPVELAVRNCIHNRAIKNKDTLANPEALDHFVGIAELQTD